MSETAPRCPLCGDLSVRHMPVEMHCRLVREAVDAALDECIADIRARCTACDDGHSGDRETDGTSIECMYCGIPIRHIRARKDASRRQPVDKSGADDE